MAKDSILRHEMISVAKVQDDRYVHVQSTVVNSFP